MNKNRKLYIRKLHIITNYKLYIRKLHVYTSRKLGSVFNIKDQTKLVHKHDLTYLVKCPENTCSETYLGETARRLSERIM